MAIFIGNPRHDSFRGTSFDDTFFTIGGKDHVNAHGGFDTVVMPDGDHTWSVGTNDGTDFVTDLGRNRVDMRGIECIQFGDGNDTVSNPGFSPSVTTCDGGAGIDTLELTAFNDFIVLDDGGVTYNGISYARFETFHISTGLETVDITTGAGNDIIHGGGGGGGFNGGAGNDAITVVGASKVDGGSGDDYIQGSTNNDTISGGFGQDTLRGGGGNDTFIFNTIQDSAVAAPDVIQDFAHGDVIDLSAAGHFTFIGDAAFSGTAGELRAQAESKYIVDVMGDADGDGTADFLIRVAHPKAGYVLSDADFVL